jgi:hypothetical protein
MQKLPLTRSIGNATNVGSNGGPYRTGQVEDNHLFDLGLNFQYKDPLWSAYINFVKNFGGAEDDENDIIANDDIDYEGWMVEAGGNLYCGPFTFTLFGFVTSGDDAFNSLNGSADGFFRMPAGVSHYWSEIMGLGTLDNAISTGLPQGGDRIATEAGYASADHPSNLWTISVGAAWQALEGTKVTFNYYYIGTVEDVIAGADNQGFLEFDSSIGHELNLYLDQKIVDKLSLRLVAAYLIADDAYTVFNDDDTYELGAQLLWAF